ncbi:MAG: hypothetical protein FH753_16715 [Firmicutes bacterium]|nr:hypothetical protein [Bacillota bacterium]MTI69780.1 hypothetical protein [Bacillota bacterium]
MEYLVSFLVFFLAYFSLNFLIAKVTKKSKYHGNLRLLTKNSFLVSLIYIVVIFVLKRIN